MASDASTMATKPRVSIKPNASSIAASGCSGRTDSGRRGAAREDDRFQFRRRRGDHVPVPEIADRGGGGGTRGHGGLDLGELAADEDRDQGTPRHLVTGD